MHCKHRFSRVSSRRKLCFLGRRRPIRQCIGFSHAYKSQASAGDAGGKRKHTSRCILAAAISRFLNPCCIAYAWSRLPIDLYSPGRIVLSLGPLECAMAWGQTVVGYKRHTRPICGGYHAFLRSHTSNLSFILPLQPFPDSGLLISWPVTHSCPIQHDLRYSSVTVIKSSKKSDSTFRQGTIFQQ